MSAFARRTTFAALTALCAVTWTAPIGARADGAVAPSAGTGVARLSVVDGEVNVQRGDSNGFTSAAVINTPVLGADYVTTGDNAHAELQFDGGTMVRLNSGVQMRLVHIDATSRELQLAVGTIDLRLLRGIDGRSLIDTPSISIKPLRSGSYRVTVTPEGETDLTVREGSAEVDTPQGAQTIDAGVTLVATGTADAPTTSTHEAIALDDFDTFNQNRDRMRGRALASNSYVNRDIDGADDLDRYGRWVDDSSYGHVWIPANTASDWSPYRDGRWVWEDGYGWTWVAAEPWGWAPYHYGRWYHSPSYGWAWYPPPVRSSPFYSPALVAFLSFGNASFGFGNVGWVPLAPYEPYYPFGYGWGQTTVINNVTNVINVTNVTNGTPTTPATLTPTTGNYRNVLVKGAVVGVSVSHFRDGRFEHPVTIGAAQLRNVTVVRGALPIVPTTANLRYSMRAVGPQVSTQPAFARTFAGNTTPIARVPFEQQRRRVESIVHAPAPAPATQPATIQATRSTQNMTVAQPVPRRAVVLPVVTPTSAANLTPARLVQPATSDPWTRFNASRGNAETPHRSAVTAPSTATYAAPHRSVDASPAERHAAASAERHVAAPVSDRVVRPQHADVPPTERRAPEARPPTHEKSTPERRVERKPEPTRKPGT